MSDEMEKLVKEMPRDAEIVELFKKLNAAGPVAGAIASDAVQKFKCSKFRNKGAPSCN